MNRSFSVAGIGVALNVVLTAILTAFLAGATNSDGDALPRPLVLAALFATPAVIASIGIAHRRRSLLLAAAAPLIPASFLSFALVTLPFALVALLYVVGTATIDAIIEPTSVRALHGIQAAAVTLLVLAAGWAVLLGLTVSGCFPIPGGERCGEGFISATGATTAGILLIGAIALAMLGRRPVAPA